MARLCSLLAAFIAVIASAATIQLHQDFSFDPCWEGINNLPGLSIGVDTVQDFGYSATHFASNAVGEIGGRVSRSLVPASYLKPVGTKTLNDAFSASGRLAVPKCVSGSGVLVGWFNHDSRGWRTPNSLAFRIDTEPNKFRVFFEYGTQHWKTGGGATFEGPYQTTKTPLIEAGDTTHAWTLSYDPSGAGGLGEITFLLDDVSYKAALSEGHKVDGAVFDRFGMINQQSSGDEMSVYIGDLVIDGERQDLTKDPEWEAAGNRVAFRDTAIRPHHNFGYRTTSFAGGQSGEIGGLVWRIERVNPEQALSFGTPIGRLTMKQPLRAAGKIAMRGAGADSALLLGWFNSHTSVGAPPANFLGVLIEGPSRVGHFFRPVCAGSARSVAVLEEGPLLYPDSASHEWLIAYTPADADGKITVAAHLDSSRAILELKPEMLEENAAFDRFGCLSWQSGGLFVEIYLDDLDYTAQAEER